jgi:3-oxoacyl-(acyl-carrier-protein) synthase
VEELSPILFRAYSALRVLAPQSGTLERMMPYDQDRDGLILGEGAGVVLLEREKVAAQRGAPVLAELADWSVTSAAPGDPWRYPADGGALARSLAQVLARCASTDCVVGGVITSASSLREPDRNEARALRRVWGEAIPPVTAPKSLLGHSGAFGGLKVALATLLLNAGFLPPTLHLSRMDPECSLPVVSGRWAPLRGGALVLPATSHGGACATLLMRSPAGACRSASDPYLP